MGTPLSSISSIAKVSVWCVSCANIIYVACSDTSAIAVSFGAFLVFFKDVFSAHPEMSPLQRWLHLDCYIALRAHGNCLSNVSPRYNAAFGFVRAPALQGRSRVAHVDELIAL